jgi:hypothetical protein
LILLLVVHVADVTLAVHLLRVLLDPVSRARTKHVMAKLRHVVLVFLQGSSSSSTGVVVILLL